MRKRYLVLTALIVLRLLLRCPVHGPPHPHVSVSIGSVDWEADLQQHLTQHGYAHIHSLLKREEVLKLRNLAENFCYGDVRQALPLSYGGYSVPGFLDVPAFSAARWLPDDDRVHVLLRAAFNGTDYRFASHNDVGCDFVGVWHKDVLRGNVAEYQECDVWSPDETGERHEIYKLMFYLQDHDKDEQAIKVIPGSHVLRKTPWEKGYIALHPQIGDAVIFDQRLSHAGNTHYNPLSPGRLFMQVGFGRKNRFTDEFERGTVERQQTLQARMLKSAVPRGFETVVADAKFTTIGALLSVLPPRLLNHFADKDVEKHIQRNCEGKTRGSRQSTSEL